MVKKTFISHDPPSPFLHSMYLFLKKNRAYIFPLPENTYILLWLFYFHRFFFFFFNPLPAILNLPQNNLGIVGWGGTSYTEPYVTISRKYLHIKKPISPTHSFRSLLFLPSAILLPTVLAPCILPFPPPPPSSEHRTLQAFMPAQRRGVEEERTGFLN